MRLIVEVLRYSTKISGTRPTRHAFTNFCTMHIIDFQCGPRSVGVRQSHLSNNFNSLFYIICNFDRVLLHMIHILLFNTGYVFKKKVRRQKHHREADKCRNNIPYIKHFILSEYCQYPVQYKQYPERSGHHRPSLPIQLHIYIQFTHPNPIS